MIQSASSTSPSPSSSTSSTPFKQISSVGASSAKLTSLIVIHNCSSVLLSRSSSIPLSHISTIVHPGSSILPSRSSSTSLPQNSTKIVVDCVHSGSSISPSLSLSTPSKQVSPAKFVPMEIQFPSSIMPSRPSSMRLLHISII